MFSNKRIKVEVQLVDGFFSTSVLGGTNMLTFEDMPVEATVSIVKLPAQFSADIKIYGCSKEHLDNMTTLKWNEGFIAKKSVFVYADDGTGYKLLFEGNIMDARPCYEGAPDVYINIKAVSGAYHNIEEVPPFSKKGIVPVHNLVRDVCAEYGMSIVDYGVVGVCKNPYYDQHGLNNRLNAIRKDFGIEIIKHNTRVDIRPKKGLYITKWLFTKNDYINYPKITDTGIQITLDKVEPIMLDEAFEIKDSEISVANGKWCAYKISFSISSKIGGNWTMTIDGAKDV